jgi:hypothetical protein
VNVEFAIELVHTPGVEEDQKDKGIYRSLLCKPEPKFVATQANAI